MKVKFNMRTSFKRNNYQAGAEVDFEKKDADVLVKKGIAKKVLGEKKD